MLAAATAQMATARPGRVGPEHKSFVSTRVRLGMATSNQVPMASDAKPPRPVIVPRAEVSRTEMGETDPSPSSGPINWAANGIAVALGVSVALSFFNGTLFGYHPALMTLGFCSFMAHG